MKVNKKEKHLLVKSPALQKEKKKKHFIFLEKITAKNHIHKS